MRKGLAFEYLVKIMILLVVAVVVLNIIFYFYHDIRNTIAERLLGEEDTVETEEVESDSFSTTELKNYVSSCWLKTGSRHDSSEICYILRGDFQGVDISEVENVDGPDTIDIDGFDPEERTVIIRFQPMLNKIEVDS